MRSRGSRILISLVLLLAAAGGFLAGVYDRYIVPIRDFQHHCDRIERMIDDLADNPPDGISVARWEASCQACQTAIANALFFPTHAPIEEVVRLEADLRRYLEEHPEPDIQTLIWFWERMGECSWPAKKYVVQLRPLFDDYLPPDWQRDASATTAGR